MHIVEETDRPVRRGHEGRHGRPGLQQAGRYSIV